jgi:hypothetical protein
VWFDNFFRANIVPIFYVETLADLDKKPRRGRVAKDFVRDVAFKTPERNSVPNIHHSSLVLESLFGHKIDLNDFRPKIAGGIPTESNGEKGYRFKVSPEAESFSRWQNEEFYELEKEFAKAWRASIQSMSFEFSEPFTKGLGIDIDACKNLQDAYDATKKIILLGNQPKLFASFVIALGIQEEFHHKIIERYNHCGWPSIADFSPYAAFVLQIDIFFYISVARGFISGDRPSNKVDISYLYYLPFCNIFISGDKLHRKTANFFMTKKQKFIWAPDLKTDLNKLNLYYECFSQEEKDLGLYSFAIYPPQKNEYLTTSLWDDFLPNWRKTMSKKKKLDSTISDSKLLQQMKQHADAPRIKGRDSDYTEENVKHVTIERSISKKKGNWYQLPKSFGEDD